MTTKIKIPPMPDFKHVYSGYGVRVDANDHALIAAIDSERAKG